MSASFPCPHCAAPIPLPRGSITQLLCPTCQTTFDLIPQATAEPVPPSEVVEAFPVADGPFPLAPQPVAQPVMQPVVVLPSTRVVAVPVPAAPPPARDEDADEADEDDRPRRRRRRDEDEEDDDDRRDRRRGAARVGARGARPDSGAKVAIIVCVAALLVVGVAVGGYFAFRGAPKDKEQARKDDAPAAPKKDPPKKDAAPLTQEQMVRKVKGSTVLIRAFSRNGTGGTGTGFFAGKPGHVVTNAHVVGYSKFEGVRKPDTIEVVIDSKGANERVVPATIYGLDIDLDLAVLKVDARDTPPLLDFGKAEALTETQPVVAFGYPLIYATGTGMTITPTTVTQLVRDRGTIERVQLGGGLNPGNSGGPVANAKGEVIGVSVSKVRDADGIAFAIPAETAREFLEDMLNNGGRINAGGIDLPQVPGPGVPGLPGPGQRATGWAPLRVPPPKPLAAPPAAFDGDRAEVKLPAAAEGACLAGGGRFVVFSLPDENKLALLDVAAAKVVKTIPVAGKVLFAGGADALVVVDVEDSRVERWSLTTFAKEATADLPVGMGLTATAVAMGCASNGPLMVQALDFPRLGERFLFDVATMKEVAGSRTHDGKQGVRPGDELRASADGRTFTQWNPEGQSAVILVTDTAYYEAPFPVKVPRTASVPGGDGQSVYALDEIAGRGGIRSGRAADRGAAYVPAATGPLFLALPKSAAGKLGVCANRDRKPLVEVPVPAALEAVLDRDKVPLVDKHVFFVPAARVLAVVSPDRDAVTLHKFDVDELLKKADDYLYVTSVPPPAVPGKPFVYQLAVKSKRPVTGFKVPNNPTLTVSETGRVACNVPGFARGPGTVAVQILDADGKEHRHEFEIVPTPPPPE